MPYIPLTTDFPKEFIAFLKPKIEAFNSICAIADYLAVVEEVLSA